MKEDFRVTGQALQPCICAEGVRDDWFEVALDYLQQTRDANGWRVLMYGA